MDYRWYALYWAFYFDEEELKKAFMEVYGNNPTQAGKLIIQISKYNNWFDIYLEVGAKKYKLKKQRSMSLNRVLMNLMIGRRYFMIIILKMVMIF